MTLSRPYILDNASYTSVKMTALSLFAHPRYRLNIALLRVLGLWPYQGKLEGKLAKFFYCLLAGTIMSPALRRCKLEPTADVFMATIPPLLTGWMALVKMINSMVKADEICELLRLMDSEWSQVTKGPVLDIMNNFAETGRKYTHIYAMLFASNLCIYITTPMIPKILEWLGIKSGSDDYVFPYPVDYIVDSDKYFFAIEFHIIVGSALVITCLVAVDSMFLVFVQHVCSMFASISYRLENLTDGADLNINLHPKKIKDRAFHTITDCIRQHNRAIEFAHLLEDTYCWSIFFVVGLNTIIMTCSGVQIVMNMENKDELCRYAPFVLGQLLHVFIESAIAQQVMDYSGQVNESLIMIKWYSLSMRSRKLLNLMSMRSRTICQITAGKIFVMSVEFFASVVKTSASYFTLLRSVQEPKE